MTTPRNDPLATAQGLTAALGTLSGRLEEAKTASEERDRALTRYGHRNRALVVTDILLTVIIALVGIQAHNATQDATRASMKATQSSASNLALCRATNVARHQQVELWAFVIGLNKGKSQTAAQKKVTAEFRTHLLVIFKPRDCAALGKKTRG